jgi:probable phosphoglycerate mutase
MTTMIYLVRHAEQDVSPDEDPAVGLGARGREQARLLGGRLRGLQLDGIHHSRAARAEQTAQILARHFPQVPIQASDLLQDRTPTPKTAAGEEYSSAERAWLAGVPAAESDPGGAQISRAIEHFSTLGPGSHLLISHAFVVGWFVRSALGSPVRSWLGLNPFNAALTVIRYRPEHPEQKINLISFNDVGHLPAEFRGPAPAPAIARDQDSFMRHPRAP